MANAMKSAMGILLVASTALASMPATAQVIPGGNAPGAQAPRTDTSQTPAPSSSPARSIAVTRDDLTGGFRAPVQGDNSMGIMSMDEFVRQQVARGGTREVATAQFEQIAQQNESGCAQTGEWVREAIAISNEAQIIDEALHGFYARLDKLGRAQGRAATMSVAANIGATGALCALSAGLYCVAGALINGGNIFQSGANKKTQRLDREMRYVNVDQSRLQIRATLLNMSATIGWAERFQAWCLVVFPQQTAGVASQAAQSPVTALASARYVEEQRGEASRDDNRRERRR